MPVPRFPIPSPSGTPDHTPAIHPGVVVPNNPSSPAGPAELFKPCRFTGHRPCAGQLHGLRGQSGSVDPALGGRSDWAGLAIIRKRRRIASGPIPRFCIPAFPPTAYSPEPKACLFPLPYPLSQLYRAGMRNAVNRVPAETVCPGRGLGKTGGETLPPGKSPGLGRSPGNLAFALASPRGGNMTLSRTLDDPLMRRNARP